MQPEALFAAPSRAQRAQWQPRWGSRSRSASCLPGAPASAGVPGSYRGAGAAETRSPADGYRHAFVQRTNIDCSITGAAVGRAKAHGRRLKTAMFHTRLIPSAETLRWRVEREAQYPGRGPAEATEPEQAAPEPLPGGQGRVWSEGETSPSLLLSRELSCTISTVTGGRSSPIAQRRGALAGMNRQYLLIGHLAAAAPGTAPEVAASVWTPLSGPAGSALPAGTVARGDAPFCRRTGSAGRTDSGARPPRW